MKKIVYGLLAFSPVMALAQTAGNAITNLNTNVVGPLRILFNAIIPLLIAVAVVYFFWGLIKYIRAAGDPKAAAEGRSIMIWGLVAIAIMASLFGLINILTSTLGVSGSGTVTYPQV